mmetsp:Transcript_37597/g.60346  ORF Transcript_37597/g.60346 Transcript_37597/m.60346 type:complete len:115 (-) Transcript_37597:917-1261(-)
MEKFLCKDTKQDGYLLLFHFLLLESMWRIFAVNHHPFWFLFPPHGHQVEMAIHHHLLPSQSEVSLTKRVRSREKFLPVSLLQAWYIFLQFKHTSIINSVLETDELCIIYTPASL